MFISIITNILLKLYLQSRFLQLVIPSSSSVRLLNCRGGSQCNLVVGNNSIVTSLICFERPNASILIGDRTFIGKSKLVSSTEISIGNDVLISWGVTLTDHNSHSIVYSERSQDVLDWRIGQKDWSAVKCSPIRVCDKAWIGFNVSILKGVTIGEGAVVAACSVVTKDVAPWTIVGGNPAKVIREIPINER